MIGTEGIIHRTILRAKDAGLCKVCEAARPRWRAPLRAPPQSGDYVVVIHGTLENRPGSTNMMKVLRVE